MNKIIFIEEKDSGSLGVSMTSIYDVVVNTLTCFAFDNEKNLFSFYKEPEIKLSNGLIYILIAINISKTANVQKVTNTMQNVIFEAMESHFDQLPYSIKIDVKKVI